MEWLFVTCAVALAGWAWWHRNRRARRDGLLATRLSPSERAMLSRDVPLVARLPRELQETLEGKMALFQDQVTFYGANGMEVTDRMARAIAAQAALLVVGNSDWYSTLRTVIVYPSAFRSKREEFDGTVMTEGESVRIGESWARGPVILSWADTARGAANDGDGKNVVFHEFAHQLDDLSGETNGFPLLADGEALKTWAAAFDDAYSRAHRLLEIGKEPFLDPYGATAPEELFAVAVEAFFETPEDLEREEPRLYEALSGYFKLDPARWR